MSDRPWVARCRFDLEQLDDFLLASVYGELDESTVGAVVADSALNRTRRIVLDLAAVTFLDSGGIYGLVKLRDRLLELRLRNPPPAVTSVLRITGLDIWVLPAD